MNPTLRAWKTRAASVITVGLLTIAPTAVFATDAHADVSGSICQSELPSQADNTLNLIDQGGPFPYSQDGVVFGNYQSVLPHQYYGYYHEYTVVTPGSRTRGARRIIVGQGDQEEYYTSDHYATFSLIDFSC
jgi:ribonuclease T1